MDIQLTEARREIDRFREREVALEEEIERQRILIYELRQELADVPRIGRPVVYDTAFKDRVKEYYNSGHTYKEIAAKFNISQTTISKFLHE